MKEESSNQNNLKHINKHNINQNNLKQAKVENMKTLQKTSVRNDKGRDLKSKSRVESQGAIEQQFDMTESYFNHLYFLNEDNAVDKSEDWWKQIENQHKRLKGDLKGLNQGVDVVKAKDFFIKNKESNPDEVKREIEHNKTLSTEVQEKLVAEFELPELRDNLATWNKLKTIARGKSGSRQDGQGADKRKTTSSLGKYENAEGITVQDAKTQLQKLTNVSNFENKYDQPNSIEQSTINNKFLKAKSKNAVKIQQVKVSDKEFKFIDPKEYQDHINNLDIDKIDFIGVQTKFSIRQRNFQGKEDSLLKPDFRNSDQFGTNIRNQVQQITTYFNRFKYQWDMRYLQKQIKSNYNIKKQWKSLKEDSKTLGMNEELDNVIENLLYTAVDQLNDNVEVEEEAATLEPKVEEGNEKSGEEDEDETKESELAKMEKFKQAQLASKEERDKINNLKNDLNNINCNTNFLKLGQIGINIYIEQPEQLRMTQVDMFKQFLKPAQSFSEQVEKLAALKQRISTIRADPDIKKKQKQNRNQQPEEDNEYQTIVDKLSLGKQLAAGFKPFKERVKFILKQSHRCRNIEED